MNGRAHVFSLKKKENGPLYGVTVRQIHYSFGSFAALIFFPHLLVCIITGNYLKHISRGCIYLYIYYLETMWYTYFIEKIAV